MSDGKCIVKYLRLSLEDEDMLDESNSITNQRIVIGQYIASKNEFKNTEVLEFKDDGYSGTNFAEVDSDTFYINHVTAVMVDNLRRLLLGINLSDKAVMDFDFPGVGFPIQFVYQDTVDKLMDVFIGQFLYVAVFPDNLNKP
mgnify:CR=1 FL=1